jgi:hypothetical protein
MVSTRVSPGRGQPDEYAVISMPTPAVLQMPVVPLKYIHMQNIVFECGRY